MSTEHGSQPSSHETSSNEKACCNKIIRGGGIIHRLAGEKGHLESVHEVRNKKRKVEEEYGDSYLIHEQVSVIPTTYQKGNTSIPHISNYFLPRTTAGAQPTVKTVMQSKEAMVKCDIAISKWMIDAYVPFNAVNSTYFQPMIDAISSMGAGYKGPNYYRVYGPLFNHWVGVVNKLVDYYRNIWKKTGCTLMADGWTDRSGRSLINFLVYCPKGTIFLKSVDASNASKTAEMLYKLFKNVILYVGAENIVHIVTDNAPNYVAAGRLLEAEFPKLFWSPCAAHCINLMLQDIGELEEVSEAMTHASKITKYIYNHCYALHLMRQHTRGREILCPTTTCFATNFIALQSIMGQKNALRAMVTSKEWTSSAYAKDSKAKTIVDQVLDSSFWKQCDDIVKLTEPLVRVFRIVDSEDKPTMSFIYGAIYQAREEMMGRFRRNKNKVEPYLEILDRRWDLQLQKNLYAAGYWLNPAIQFNNDELDKHQNTITGILNVIERYSYGDLDLQAKLTNEMRIFKNAEGDFGRQIAIHDRNTVMPDQWWELYGCDAPNLQKLAIRILSQTCSSSGCELNWSVFEHIHSIKCNRLVHQKLNARAYVRYNFRLHQRKQSMHKKYEPIKFETFDVHSNWVMEESTPYPTNEEVDDLLNDLASMTIQPISDNIGQINLDDNEDEQAQYMGEANQNASNVDEDPNFFFC
ncbi:unnamed protein product [Rhodiola kirilowii]